MQEETKFKVGDKVKLIEYNNTTGYIVKYCGNDRYLVELDKNSAPDGWSRDSDVPDEWESIGEDKYWYVNKNELVLISRYEKDNKDWQKSILHNANEHSAYFLVYDTSSDYSNETLNCNDYGEFSRVLKEFNETIK